MYKSVSRFNSRLLEKVNQVIKEREFSPTLEKNICIRKNKTPIPSPPEIINDENFVADLENWLEDLIKEKEESAQPLLKNPLLSKNEPMKEDLSPKLSAKAHSFLEELQHAMDNKQIPLENKESTPPLIHQKETEEQNKPLLHKAFEELEKVKYKNRENFFKI